MKKAKSETTLVRAALYIRVSGEEQKIKGLSLEAQEERLRDFCKERGWLICGVFIDAAKTARKNIKKRVEFQNMIDGVKQDEYDVLVFCRLDRWFRSVADYYKIMDILNSHNCGWVTSDEDYDTTTANGRLYINVKLSISQNESDICSERIGVVFDSKVQHGTVLSGNAPFWLKVQDKRYVLDPEKVEIIRDALDYFEKEMTQRGTVTYIREKYGINWCYASFARMIRDKLLIGVYDKNGRYNENFCPAAISKQQFDNIQRILGKNVKRTPAGRIYIFTSVLKCYECGHNLCGQLNKGIYYYRCNDFALRKRCTHNRFIREDKIEKYLLENLERELNKCELEWTMKAKKKQNNPAIIQRATLKRKLSKLKDLYLNELIELDEYKKDFEMYSNALDRLNDQIEKEEPAPNFKRVHELLDNNFTEMYKSLDRKEKRMFWQSVLKEVVIDRDLNIVSVSFA